MVPTDGLFSLHIKLHTKPNLIFMREMPLCVHWYLKPNLVAPLCEVITLR